MRSTGSTRGSWLGGAVIGILAFGLLVAAAAYVQRSSRLMAVAVASICVMLGIAFLLRWFLSQRPPRPRRTRSGPSIEREPEAEVITARRLDREILRPLQEILQAAGRDRRASPTLQRCVEELRELEQRVLSMMAQPASEATLLGAMDALQQTAMVVPRKVSLGALLKDVATEQKVLMDARGMQFEAILGHRKKEIHYPESALRAVLQELMAYTLQESQEGEALSLMTRELSGVLVVSLRGSRARAVRHRIPPGVSQRVKEWGGEVWPEEKVPGFGLTLPLSGSGAGATPLVMARG